MNAFLQYFIINIIKYIWRYKLISKTTWPKFRNGDDKEATRVLIREQGFENDVKYGKTKIFIRSPKTMFALEHKREEHLPDICRKLQRVKIIGLSLKVLFSIDWYRGSDYQSRYNNYSLSSSLSLSLPLSRPLSLSLSSSLVLSLSLSLS